MTPTRRAANTIRFHGRDVPRRSGFVLGHHLECCGGHRFRPNIGADALVFFCSHREGPGRICGAAVYLLSLQRRGDLQPPMLWFTDVDPSDIESLREMSTVNEILRYFGVFVDQKERSK